MLSEHFKMWVLTAMDLEAAVERKHRELRKAEEEYRGALENSMDAHRRLDAVRRAESLADNCYVTFMDRCFHLQAIRADRTEVREFSLQP